jgi:hypothetical protein
MASPPYVVVYGYLQNESKENYEIITSAGDLIRVPAKGVAKKTSVEIGKGKGGLMQFFLDRDCSIELTMPAVALPREQTDTTLKYYDDGSTIRKSLDDDARGLNL